MKFCRTNKPPLDLKTDLIELGLMDLQLFAPPPGVKEGRVLFAADLKGVKFFIPPPLLPYPPIPRQTKPN